MADLRPIGRNGLSYLELQHLHKAFGNVPAVVDFNLSVGQGEFVSLLGPSGCGKTTTLRMVAGFEPPDRGSVFLDGAVIDAVPAEQRGMGVVFQHYALFPNMTAWSNVAFGLRAAGKPRAEMEARVEEMLRLVGLQEAGHKYPRELSGGQQQRVALARALAIQPRVLLLDEPLSALDAVVRVGLRQEIRHIQSTLGITTIYVTHDQEEALSISDRVVVMQRGMIEQVGTPEVIYTSPATHFVANFIGTVNQFAGVSEGAGGDRVRCGDLVLQVAGEGVPLRPAESVVVMVRPEAIRVGATPEEVGAVNRMTGRLETVIFLGPVTRFVLSCGGRQVVADVSAHDRGRFPRGKDLWLAIEPTACQVMSAPLETSQQELA
jgi:putative spermidine/putrescine transport system ATP-binding protein